MSKIREEDVCEAIEPMVAILKFFVVVGLFSVAVTIVAHIFGVWETPIF